MSLKIINTGGSRGLTLKNSGGIGSFSLTQTPSLVTNGLTLRLDAGNDTSYGSDSSTNVATFAGGNLFNGRIAKVYCYNRSITAEEVLRNYNFDKSQFGL